MEKKTYNVILTNLSLVNFNTMKEYSNNMAKYTIDDNLSNLTENTYFYKNEDFMKNIQGILTNEAGIRFVMQSLKDKDDYLDAIYYVASQSVRKKMKDCDISHVEFFERRMRLYCQQENIKVIPDFLPPNGEIIEDDPNSNSLIDLSAKIANTIIQLKDGKAKDKELNLYIESNGGFRDFMLIVVAIIQSLNSDIANIKSVIGVNFNPTVAMHPIHNKTRAYQVYDLYSGIDEFINYGRSNKIQLFFQNNNFSIEQFSEMNSVLSSINYMGNAFNLCRPFQMLDATKKLKNAIENYENSLNKLEIFNLLTNRVKKEYLDIFDIISKEDIYSYPVLRQLILYCLKHSLVQQALTLYSERIPDILYKRKILYPSTIEKQLSDERIQLNVDFEQFIQSKTGFYSQAYTYIQHYIFNPSLNKKRNIRGLLYLFNKIEHKKYYPKNIEKKCDILKLYLDKNYVFTQFVERKDEVVDIFRNYLKIKNERNVSNHANDEEKEDFYTKFSVMSENDENKRVLDMINDALTQLDSLLLNSNNKIITSEN